MKTIRLSVLIFTALLACTSCSQTNPLGIWSDSEGTQVFYGTYEVGEDEYTGPGFVYGRINLKWEGEGTFKISSVRIKFKASRKLTSDFECVIDGDDLLLLFGTDELEPGDEIKGGSVICTGLAAVSKRAQFQLTGTAHIYGVSGELTSSRVQAAETKLFLYWFPEEI